MLRLGFRFIFENNYVLLHLRTIYYGRGFISNGFLILDIEYYNNDSSVFLTSSDNAFDNSIIWHARLSHIGQERMTRLAREGLMGNLARSLCPHANIVLWESQKENRLEKPQGHLFHCN